MTGNSHGRVQQTASMEITARLVRRVVDNEYRAGTKLPTERDLAVEFGVTRHVVREALKRLEAVGLVRIRQGSGIYVQDVQITGGIELFEMLLTQTDGSINLPILRDVLEFRGHLARLVVRLAAARRAPEEMAEIREVFEQRRASRGGTAALEEANLRIFQLIAQATHNKVYELVFNTMGRVFIKLRALVDIPLMGVEQTEQILERVIEALEQRDEEMADLLVTRYLAAVQQSLDVTQRSLSSP